MKDDANGAKLGKSHSYITQTYFQSRNWVPIARRWYGPIIGKIALWGSLGNSTVCTDMNEIEGEE